MFVTGGLAFVSFYSVIVFIDNNADNDSQNSVFGVKRMPKIDPDFLMDEATQKNSEIWMPVSYFAFNIVSSLILRSPLV